VEEFIAGLFFGGLFAFPTGWFLKTAFVWRREAKKMAQPEGRVINQSAPAPSHAAAGVESRLERMVDLVNRRLEAMEERMEFAERLLDSRSTSRLDGPVAEARRNIAASPRVEGETTRR
jgi:hypothetical protein